MSTRTFSPARLRRLGAATVLFAALAGGWISGRGGAVAERPSADAARGGESDLPFTTPPGFVAERVAGPPLIEYPMFACFDDRGRLYVVDSAGVNQLPDELSKNPPHRIRLLEDTKGVGSFDKSTVFADRLTYPQGVLWHDGAVYTASPPSLWRMEDTKGIGVADKREELFTGFTFTKWADDLHGPFLGPDGWIYWTSGRYPHAVKRPGGDVLISGDGPRVLRCRPDGADAEVYCNAIGNAVEVAFSEEGEAFAAGTFANLGRARDDVIFHAVYGGIYPILDRDVNALRGVRHTGEPLPAMVHFGVAAPSGLMLYRDAAWGEAYRNNLFSALFRARAVRRHVLKGDRSTLQASTEDFLTARTDDFHPTDVLEDADGSLLVVDTGNWYNLCPSSRVGASPVKGGIYRIRRKGAAPVADPRGLNLAWDKCTPKELATLLGDERFAVRDRAVERLAKMGADALAALKETVARSDSPPARGNAVWALTRMDRADARAAVRLVLDDRDPGVCQAAVHSAGLNRDADASPRLLDIVKNDGPSLRREAAAALGRIRDKKAEPALLDALADSQDPFLQHSLIFALIEIADRDGLVQALQDSRPSVRRGALIALDQIDGGALTPEMVDALLDPGQPALRDEALRILAAHPEWARQSAEAFRAWLLEDKVAGQRPEDLRRLLVAYCKDPALQELVARALRRDKLPADTRLGLLEVVAQAPVDKVPLLWLAEVGWSLDDKDERVVRQAVEDLRVAGAGDFDGALLRLAADDSRPADLRVEALAAAAPRITRLDEGLFAFLTRRLDRDQPPLLRLKAAEALGQAELSDGQLCTLTPAVAAAGPLETPKLLAAYEKSKNPDVGKRLLDALADSPGLRGATPELLTRTLKGYPEEVRNAGDALAQKLGAGTEKQAARLAQLRPLLAKGDAGRGRDLFFGKKAMCSACHSVASQGGRIGPDLSHVAASRSGPDLLESIVFPSASFARGYEPYLVTMTSGEVYNGIIARQTADALYLVNAERAEVRLGRSAIESVEPGKTSIMPQGLDAMLSEQELADVLAFLQSLR